MLMKTAHQLRNLLFITLLALAGCMNNDVYNPDSKPDNEPDNGNVTDLTIPSDFLWSTTAQVAVHVTIGNNTPHTYTISIYSQGADEESLPVAIGTASFNYPYNKEITLPASDTIVTVTQTLHYTDGSQMTLECNVPIVNKKATLHLGESGNTVSSTRSPNITTRSDDDLEDWNEAKELTTDITKINKNEEYKVSTGNMVNLNDNINIMEGGKIYIAGTLNISAKNAFQNHKDAKFIILSKEQSKGEAAGILQCFGDFTVKNEFEIENYGTMTVNGTLAIENGGEIDNYGCLHAEKIELDGNGKDDSLLEIKERGYVFSKTMWMQKATLEMEKNSLLEIEETLELKNDCEIEGDDDGKWAVVKLTNATVINEHNGETPQIKNKVFVVCDHNNGEKPKSIYSEGGAQWGNTKAAANAGVKTTGSDCAPAYKPEEGGTPEEPGNDKEYTLGQYTYAFEDLWPNFGDYDMNDIVLVTKVTLKVTGNYVTQATLKCKLAAIGASKRISAGVQLDELTAGDISSIQYDTSNNFTENMFKTNANGTEQGQTLAVVPLFDHAHAFAGYNGTPIVGTYKDAEFNPKEFTVTIHFKENSVEESKLALNKLNFFITCNATQGKRMEIHQINGKATDLFDTSAIGGVVASPNTPFRAKGNFCWVMIIPGEFSFPLEGNNLRQSFENFELWIANPDYDWYNHPFPDKVKQ